MLHEDSLISDWLLAGYNLEEATKLAELSRKYQSTVVVDVEEFNRCLIIAMKNYKF